MDKMKPEEKMNFIRSIIDDKMQNLKLNDKRQAKQHFDNVKKELQNIKKDSKKINNEPNKLKKKLVQDSQKLQKKLDNFQQKQKEVDQIIKSINQKMISQKKFFDNQKAEDKNKLNKNVVISYDDEVEDYNNQKNIKQNTLDHYQEQKRYYNNLYYQINQVKNQNNNIDTNKILNDEEEMEQNKNQDRNGKKEKVIQEGKTEQSKKIDYDMPKTKKQWVIREQNKYLEEEIKMTKKSRFYAYEYKKQTKLLSQIGKVMDSYGLLEEDKYKQIQMVKYLLNEKQKEQQLEDFLPPMLMQQVDQKKKKLLQERLEIEKDLDDLQINDTINEEEHDNIITGKNQQANKNLEHFLRKIVQLDIGAPLLNYGRIQQLQDAMRAFKVTDPEAYLKYFYLRYIQHEDEQKSEFDNLNENEQKQENNENYQTNIDINVQQNKYDEGQIDQNLKSSNFQTEISDQPEFSQNSIQKINQNSFEQIVPDQSQRQDIRQSTKQCINESQKAYKHQDDIKNEKQIISLQNIKIFDQNNDLIQNTVESNFENDTQQDDIQILHKFLTGNQIDISDEELDRRIERNFKEFKQILKLLENDKKIESVSQIKPKTNVRKRKKVDYFQLLDKKPWQKKQNIESKAYTQNIEIDFQKKQNKNEKQKEQEENEEGEKAVKSVLKGIDDFLLYHQKKNNVKNMIFEKWAQKKMVNTDKQRKGVYSQQGAHRPKF
ncbi:hypothetical protein PPERSA_08945 [Pseudocohnilembus persalinus]|uniref:Uncharacterized protein n=1 Tax=Pseudocohnilembus persalinus TaxID=266149 RepID=A0A0V0R2V4_PSEPJ|nr:hypothetical protein PPERSA_08945 [Pseudocohnilembus persalinus]|eukprot:KRX08841.1 hypothetical protein PPERSA_08945 [Pseudocohnilembus persalinus]